MPEGDTCVMFTMPSGDRTFVDRTEKDPVSSSVATHISTDHVVDDDRPVAPLRHLPFAAVDGVNATTVPTPSGDAPDPKSAVPDPVPTLAIASAGP